MLSQAVKVPAFIDILLLGAVTCHSPATPTTSHGTRRWRLKVSQTLRGTLLLGQFVCRRWTWKVGLWRWKCIWVKWTEIVGFAIWFWRVIEKLGCQLSWDVFVKVIWVLLTSNVLRHGSRLREIREYKSTFSMIFCSSMFMALCVSTFCM